MLSRIQKQTYIGAGIGLSIGLIIGYLLRRQKQNRRAQQPLLRDSAELMKEQLTRNAQFFGEINQSKIQNSYILVFGAGGVGSHVITSLIRSGVSQVGIVDFDRVTLSSLNRHAIATRKDVGKSKVEIFQAFAQDVNPKAQLHIFETYVTEKNLDQFFHIKPDFVVDCIDNIQAKVALIAYCVNHNIKIIVSCGAGMKSDPTRIQIRDISESNSDALARSIRIRLKKHNIKTGFPMVFSYEQNDKELMPLKEHQVQDPSAYKVMPNYRLRIVPVFGCMPALMAYSLASYVLCEIGDHHFEPHKQDDIKVQLYEKAYSMLLQQSNNNKTDFYIELEEVRYLMREVYDMKCLVLNRRCQLAQLIQWDPTTVTVNNVVLMNRQAAQKHRKCRNFEEVLKLYDESILKRKEEFDKKIVKQQL